NAGAAIAHLHRDRRAAGPPVVACEHDLEGAAAVALAVLEEVAHRATQQPLVAVDDDAAHAVDVRADARRLLGSDREQVDAIAMERVLDDLEPAREQHLLDEAVELAE